MMSINRRLDTIETSLQQQRAAARCDDCRDRPEYPIVHDTDERPLDERQYRCAVCGWAPTAIIRVVYDQPGGFS